VAQQGAPDPLATPLSQLVDDCRTVLAQSGTKAEASLYSQFERFLQDSFDVLRPGAASADKYLFLQQTNADQLGVPDFRVQQKQEPDVPHFSLSVWPPPRMATDPRCVVRGGGVRLLLLRFLPSW